MGGGKNIPNLTANQKHMKKLLFSAAAMALAFFAASCQQENLEPVAGANTVTYTVQVSDAITKAIGDDVSSVNELVYEVYRTKEDGVMEFTEGVDNFLYHNTAEINGGVATIELELINGQNFTVLFWAHKAGNGVYDADDLTNVTITSPDAANNVDAQAFVGRDFIRKETGSDANGHVTLKRAVSQLNIGTTAQSLKAFEDLVVLNKSSVSVSGLSTSYNIATLQAGQPALDEAGNFAVYQYTESDVIKTDSLRVNDVNYAYVAMNYVGFAADNGSTVTVSYKINTSEGDIENTIDNVPVKPNYRTNIIGNLITSKTEYTIELDSNWKTPAEVVEVVSVDSAEELQAAIENAPVDGTMTNIKLEGDVDLSQIAGLVSSKVTIPYTTKLAIPSSVSVVIDLNGMNLTYSSDVQNEGMIHNYGNLILIGDGIVTYTYTGENDPNYSYGNYAINNSGNLVIDGPVVSVVKKDHAQNTKYLHALYAVNNSGTFTLKSGRVENYHNTAVRQLVSNETTPSTITINDGEIYGLRAIWIQLPNNNTSLAPKGTLNVNGGSLIAWENAADYDGGNRLAVYSYSYGSQMKDVEINITDGTIDGTIDLTGGRIGAKNDVEKVTVTGGTFNGLINSYADDELASESIAISGGVFAAEQSKYIAEGYCVKNVDSKFEVVPAAAKIGKTGYMTLTAAVNAVKEGETIEILANLEESIKLPATLKNVTFLGTEKSVLKNMTISAADGNSYNYVGLTFDGLTFDNSRIILTGWRNGDEVINNLKITNCTFKNIYDTTNNAAVHINKDAAEAVNGFTFTKNVIDGATGGSKSGIYAQVTGNVEVKDNVINNVSFRPYVIQITTDDGIDDNFVVTGNTFSGSKAGRAQGLGNNDAGTDQVNLVVSNNIFKDITESQQICYWNFNAENTTADLSGNYYDIDILKNPSRIYYNAAATGEADLINMNVFPIYTELNADGTINFNSAFAPAPVKIGETDYNTLEEAVAAAKAGDIISLKDNVTLAAELRLPADITIQSNGKQIEGSIVAGGNLTFVGHTKVTSFSASYYNRVITIGEGACLEITGTGRVTLGYGNTFNITGSIENAKTAVKSNIQPSLIIPGGISITGGSGAAMNVTHAYVKIGSTTSKPGVANGTFALNFKNSIAEFTKEFGFYEPTEGKNPEFMLNLTNSVFTTAAKLCVASTKSTVIIDNSIVNLGTYIRNSGDLELKNGSVLTGSTIQFGENGGNNGAITVDASELTITATSTGHALDGKGTGSITLKNGAKAAVTYYKDMTITSDATSEFTGTEVK